MPIPLHKCFYIDPNYCKLRKHKLRVISDSLLSNNEFKQFTFDKQTNIVKDLEKGCMYHSQELCQKNNISILWDCSIFQNTYHRICYRLVTNIDTNSLVGGSPYLINLILHNYNSSKILQSLAKMSSQEMFPKHYEKIVSNIKSDMDIKFKTSRLYYCGKCKNNKTIVKDLQTRCGDEPSTNVITCTICNNIWSIG